MKVLFLYTELSAYFLSCLENFSKKKDIEIHVVHWAQNREAPFRFTFPNTIQFYKRAEFDTARLSILANNISPDLIYSSGWKDKSYLSVCGKFRKKNIPVIVGFDNKWTGSLKQIAGSLLSKKIIHKNFSHCWIPGNPQLEFARRLKFSDNAILQGCYSCDHEFFYARYLEFKYAKKKKFPHRFIFTGRYYEFKGIKDLWQAFTEFQKESPNDWELWCLGTGDIKPIVHPKIKHFGFVQPKDMAKFICDTGVYVLPSHFEPWGVAVHEFASAGFPIICSHEVGAASAFVKNGENGIVFSSGRVDELKKTLKAIASMPDEKLFTMGEKSALLSDKITPSKWADTLLSVLNKKLR